MLFRKSKTETSQPDQNLINLPGVEQSQPKSFLTKARDFVSSHQLLTFALAFALIGGLILLKSFALVPGASWQSYADLVKNGQLAPAGQIYQVNFAYDSAAKNPLSVANIQQKTGYADSVDNPIGDNYLLLKDSTGNILKSLRFNIPSQIDAEDFVAKTSKTQTLSKTNFSLIVSKPSGVAKLQVLDTKGNEILANNLSQVSTVNNKLDFNLLLPPQTAAAQSQPLAEATKSSAAGHGKTTIIFVGDNYTTAQLSQFQSDKMRFESKMMSIEPFKSSKKIAFGSVNNTSSLGCVYGDGSSEVKRLLTCDSTKVHDAVAGSNYTKIFVIHNTNGAEGDGAYGGSGSAIGGDYAVAYNGQDGPSMFVHETGHLFGLQDEYYYTTDPVTQLSPDNMVHGNCWAGTPPTSAWTTPVSSYQEGCGRQGQWYRSTSCSIMRDLHCQYFNAVSILLMVPYTGSTGGIDKTPPSKVTNLHITGVFDNQVNLAWNESTDNILLDHYDIYRSTAGGSFTKVGFALPGLPGVLAPFYLDYPLTSATHYNYYIVAVDSTGNQSNPSSKVSVTTTGTDNTPPSIPGNFHANVLTGTQIKLQWSAATDNVAVDHYVVYRNGVSRYSGSNLNFTDGELQPSTTYAYSVYAFDAVGNKSAYDPSIALQATTLPPDTTPPSVPGSMSSHTVSSSEIDISWGTSTDNPGGWGLAGYEIYRNGSYYRTVSGTTYQDTGLNANTLYNYYVKAVDKAGNKSAASGTSGSVTNPASGNSTQNTCFDDSGAFAHQGNCTNPEHNAGYTTGSGCYSPSGTYLYKGQCTS